MLALIHAAEVQFRHEFETRQRDHALLASMREHHAAHAHPVEPTVVAAAILAPQGQTRGYAERTRAEWPRPIGVRTCPGPACAAA